MSERTYTRQDVDDIVAPWLKLCKEQSDELAELRESIAVCERARMYNGSAGTCKTHMNIRAALLKEKGE